jgi:predicted phage replisome organizer
MKDFFQQPKIKKLRRIAGGDTYTVIYLKMLLLSLENDGQLYYEGIETEFADELSLTIDEDIDNVRFVLLYLQQQGLIDEVNQGEFVLPEAVKCIGSESESAERMRNLRQRRAEALLMPGTSQSDALVTKSDTEKETELEEDKSKRKEKTDYQLIADMYNTICTSFPSLRSLSDARKKAIKARLKTYSVDDFKTMFENAEASSFLKGNNNRNWTANFDWLLKDTNMAKVLDGNYCDRNKTPANKINRDDYENGDQLPW